MYAPSLGYDEITVEDFYETFQQKIELIKKSLKCSSWGIFLGISMLK